VRLRERNVLAIAFGPEVRMVTHYDVSRADIETTLGEIRRVVSNQQKLKTDY
jgi:threonine aldolase